MDTAGAFSSVYMQRQRNVCCAVAAAPTIVQAMAARHTAVQPRGEATGRIAQLLGGGPAARPAGLNQFGAAPSNRPTSAFPSDGIRAVLYWRPGILGAIFQALDAASHNVIGPVNSVGGDPDPQRPVDAPRFGDMLLACAATQENPSMAPATRCSEGCRAFAYPRDPRYIRYGCFYHRRPHRQRDVRVFGGRRHRSRWYVATSGNDHHRSDDDARLCGAGQFAAIARSADPIHRPHLRPLRDWRRQSATSGPEPTR